MVKKKAPAERNAARLKFLKAIKQFEYKEPTSRAALVLPSLATEVLPFYQPLQPPFEQARRELYEQYHELYPQLQSFHIPQMEAVYLMEWQALSAFVLDKDAAILLADCQEALSELEGMLAQTDKANVAAREWINALADHFQEMRSQLLQQDSLANAGLKDLYQALDDWSHRFHLTDVWLLDHALQTLAKICRDGAKELDWQYELKGFAITGFEHYKEFQFPIFNPEMHVETSYRERIKQFELQVRLEIQESLQMKKLRKHSDCHFDWLVDFQVNELNYSMLARKYGGENYNKAGREDVGFVRDSIRNLALKVIRLNLRPSKRGRPTS